MKITHRIPFAVLAAGVFMLVAGLAGLSSMWQVQQRYAGEVVLLAKQAAQLQTALGDFKTQVQEWKNILIRGADAQSLEKHWAGFEAEEAKVQKQARHLAETTALPEQRQQLQAFIAAHAKAGQVYRKGLEAFKASGFDAKAGDAAVKGVDWEPSALLDKLAEEKLERSRTAATQADAAGRQAAWVMLGALLLGLVVGGVLARWASLSLKRLLGAEPERLQQASRELALGNLHHAVQLRTGDSASVAASLMAMRDALASALGDVRRASDGVATAATQIAQGNMDLSGRTEQQASALQQTAASMEELGSTVRQNADNARQANQLALRASEVAGHGGEVVGQVVDTMKDINESSRQIADIISVIDGIAFQTNILALNAAVEAARAGEQGRGFAVVATEVRTLAKRSSEAAREIRELITTATQRVDSGALLVGEAGTQMTEIVSAIKRTTDVIAEIASAAATQHQGIQQIGEEVRNMDEMTQRNSALVEEASAAAEQLDTQSARMADSMAAFRLGAPPAQNIRGTDSARAGQSRHLMPA